jgi:branched-subunit amino acid transport protein
MRQWLIIAVAGAGTYGIRLSMLAVAHRPLPPLFRDALRFVAPAVLMAFVAQLVLYTGEPRAFEAGIGNERLFATLAAAAIAWVSHNAWVTIAGGMAALWLLQWLT